MIYEENNQIEFYIDILKNTGNLWDGIQNEMLMQYQVEDNELRLEFNEDILTFYLEE